MRSDNGISEVIGYVLILALVFSTLTAVLGLGMPAINESRDIVQTKNALRAFNILQDNIEDLTKNRVSKRSTEIRLSGASFIIAEPVKISIKLPDSGKRFVFKPRPLIYKLHDGQKVIYNMGAVFLDTNPEDATNARMMSYPEMVNKNGNLLYPVVETKQAYSEPSVISKQGTLLIRTYTSSSPTYIAESQSTVQVNMTTPRASAWSQYYEQKLGMSCKRVSPNKITCEKDSVSRFFLKHNYVLVNLD